MVSKSTTKTPFLSVVLTSLNLGTSAEVAVTVTPSIGAPSGSTTLPTSRPFRAAETSPGTATIRMRNHTIARCVFDIGEPPSGRVPGCFPRRLRGTRNSTRELRADRCRPTGRDRQYSARRDLRRCADGMSGALGGSWALRVVLVVGLIPRSVVRPARVAVRRRGFERAGVPAPGGIGRGQLISPALPAAGGPLVPLPEVAARHQGRERSLAGFLADGELEVADGRVPVAGAVRFAGALKAVVRVLHAVMDHPLPVRRGAPGITLPLVEAGQVAHGDELVPVRLQRLQVGSLGVGEMAEPQVQRAEVRPGR